MATVEIFSATSTTEAHLLKGLLAQHGIEAEVTGHYLQGAFGELPVTNMIQILVDSNDEQRARDIIDRYDRGEYAIEEEIPYSQRRKMREGAIRSDMQTLVKYCILNRIKIGRIYIYSIRAKTIIDSYTSKKYSLLDAKRIKALYEREIRPSPANIDIIREIRAREITATVEG